ncbi:hypothetical protein PENTCL1PPCAC_20293 [Pristionchus entomophagus]|uniref:G protein-coupled receptor n=1 Tax=Pristionchus entomophagus TaxID=358040 RepID=A0AAV5TVU2_9BILA|nr:hypothetical protein PENTCL1PPCAC_20293 [Pristionchus entomophagus]
MLFRPVFVSFAAETAIFTAQKVVFVFSMAFNCLALVCLHKQTPPQQSTFRNYLILIQSWMIIPDFVFEICFETVRFVQYTAGTVVAFCAKQAFSFLTWCRYS